MSSRDAAHKTVALKRAAAARLPFLGNLTTVAPAGGGERPQPHTAAVTPLPPFAAGGAPLQLQSPDEPADVLFENLGVSRAEVMLRRAALSLVLYAVILGAFVAASVADTIQNEVEIRGECVQCGVYDEAGAVPTLTSAQKERFQACHDNGEPAPTTVLTRGADAHSTFAWTLLHASHASRVHEIRSASCPF